MWAYSVWFLTVPSYLLRTGYLDRFHASRLRSGKEVGPTRRWEKVVAAKAQTRDRSGVGFEGCGGDMLSRCGSEAWYYSRGWTRTPFSGVSGVGWMLACPSPRRSLLFRGEGDGWRWSLSDDSRNRSFQWDCLLFYHALILIGDRQFLKKTWHVMCRPQRHPPARRRLPMMLVCRCDDDILLLLQRACVGAFDLPLPSLAHAGY